MKVPLITHPRTGKQDPMLTLAYFVVVVCGVKFLFEGVSFAVMGHTISLGHADAMTYGALLTPVLGAHGYIDTKNNSAGQKDASE